MEERYKSLAAMKSEPWIAHFKKTVGQPSLWGPASRPVVIRPTKKNSPGESAASGGGKVNMPLNVVSPIEQYSEMAEAEMHKTQSQPGDFSVQQRPRSSTQRKRKAASPASSDKAAKKVQRVKDIFSRHGHQ